jgi:hypothetical protein
VIILWFSTHPAAAGAITFLLMWSDWLLTLWQKRQRETYQSDHTRTYPVDTIEGNLLLKSAIEQKRWIEPKHFSAALLVSVATALGLLYVPSPLRPVLLGYVWGLFLIVDTTHIGNLIGYRVCRRGTHGQLWLHQRTAFLVQAGRYAALALLLVVLAILSASPFMAGVACAGIGSVVRQFGWLRRTPKISANDGPPSDAGGNEPMKALGPALSPDR